jgi:hypothetical protein
VKKTVKKVGENDNIDREFEAVMLAMTLGTIYR